MKKQGEHVHKLRHRYKAIMAGIGTVLADDPLLTCRLEDGIDPVRIICDSDLRIPLDSQIVKTAKDIPTIAVYCEDNKAGLLDKIEKLKANGVETLCIGKKDGHIDLNELMYELGKRDIDSILLEGGGTLNWSALDSGIVNKVYTYIAPKLFGGKEAKTPIEGRGTDCPQNAALLKSGKVMMLGDDLLIESEVLNNVYGNS